KQAAGTSHDAAKAVAPNFSAGTCSAIVCHNGNSANWSDPVAGDCQKCHTALPQ
ncbi:MAG: CxxxxCH/CxxCH domain-containing protein, partial [Desulfuromonadales bacterium]|nr:CxxxxCH/CxxCH domain-containing protein [Desulfuromonadales bacterium]